jgi:PAS domain S-box-containing protein
MNKRKVACNRRRNFKTSPRGSVRDSTDGTMRKSSKGAAKNKEADRRASVRANLHENAVPRSMVRYSPNGDASLIELDYATKRYADLYELAPIGYVSFDRSGRIGEINLTAAQLFGLPRDRMIGMPFAVFVWRKDTALFLHHLAQCRCGQARVETELRLKTVPGKPIHAQIFSTPITASPHNGAVLFQTAIIDLTGRKIAEQQLELISRLPAENPSPVMRLQHNRIVNFANSAAEGLLQQLGARVGGVAPKEILQAARRGKGSVELEFFGRTYNVSVAPIKHSGYTNLYFSDISGRKQQERRLAELAHILNLTNDAMVVRDLQDRVVYWNKGAEEIYGFAAAEAVGKVTHDLLRTKHPKAIEAITKELYRHDRWSGELVHTRKDGRQITVFSRWSLDRDNRGRPEAILESNNDITARKHTEEVLRERENELELIITQTPFMLTRCTRDLRYRYVSRAYAKLVGRDPEDIADKPMVQIIGEQTLKRIWPHIRKVLQGHKVAYEEEALLDGTRGRWLQCIYSPDRNSNGEVIGWFGSIIDISQRKKAETSLRRSKELLEKRVRQRTHELQTLNTELKAEIQRRKGLEGEILSVSDREQQRLGRELHDGLCQHLAGVAFMARSMALRLRNHRVVDAADIDKVAELVNKAAVDTRNLSRVLHRFDVDAAGLARALQDLVDREFWRIPCRLQVKPSFHISDDAAAANLYRIAREAVINANKHARARQIMIKLEGSARGIVLHVTDDGVGVSKERGFESGLGFHIMNYRAQLIGGRLEIRSQKAGGTRVSCYLPLQASRSSKS